MRMSDWSSDVCSSDLEIRERCGGVRGPFRTKVLWRDVACGNEYDGVVCFGDLIEPRGMLAVSVGRRWLQDIEAHVEYAHPVAGPRIGNGVGHFVEELGQSFKIGRASCRERGGQYG